MAWSKLRDNRIRQRHFMYHLNCAMMKAGRELKQTWEKRLGKSKWIHPFILLRRVDLHQMKIAYVCEKRVLRNPQVNTIFWNNTSKQCSQLWVRTIGIHFQIRPLIGSLDLSELTYGIYSPSMRRNANSSIGKLFWAIPPRISGPTRTKERADWLLINIIWLKNQGCSFFGGKALVLQLAVPSIKK